MQQEEIREQYELWNLTRIETAKYRKLLRKLDKELLQLNASFALISRETNMLIYGKNFTLAKFKLRGKLVVL